MHHNLTPAVKVTRVLNAVAAGTTDQNSSTVDMEGYDAVMFVALFGALTATQVTLIKAQQGDQSNGSDAVDITGAASAALADADSNKGLILDVVRPQKRYVRCVVDRGTANAVIDGVIAVQYNGRKSPETNDTTIKETVLKVVT